MKKVNFLYLLFLILISNICFSQISISDKSAKPTIKAIPYDGSFQNFESKVTLTKEHKAGVVGEKITLIDGQFKIKDENGIDISVLKSIEFQNKTFIVLDYVDGLIPVLKIENELGKFSFNPTFFCNYVFNKYPETVSKMFLDKIFIPTLDKSVISSLDGRKIELLNSVDYKITKVSFSKLPNGYGMVFLINDDFECKLIDDPFIDLEVGYFEVSGREDYFNSKVKFVEKSLNNVIQKQ